MKRVLCVDDEEQVLESLRDLVRPYRASLKVEFAIGGEEALRKLANDEAYDVVVSDVRMPGMDGVSLLARVKQEHPGAARIVLSGQTDAATALRAAGVAHQFLTKPCEGPQLLSTINRACVLHDVIDDERIRNLVTGAGTLPSAPASFAALRVLADDPEATTEAVAAVVERDIAMCAKVLQLVNSAFFGLGRRVASAREAVVYLGMDTVRSLVLAVETFSRFGANDVPGFSIEALEAHSSGVAEAAAALSTSAVDRNDAWLAGMLHDVGLLFLADRDREGVVCLMDNVARGMTEADAQRVAFGTTHARVGAYLLALWGLPDNVVEAVAALDNDDAADPGSLVAVLRAAHSSVEIAEVAS